MAATNRQIDFSWIEEQALEIVRELLSELGSHRAARNLALDSSFERDLGLGTLERVELLVRCEARFDIQLPDEIAHRAETPAEWVRGILEGITVPVAERRSRMEPLRREAPATPHAAANLAEVLRRHAEIEPDRVHVHLPEEAGGRDITYSGLLEAASAVAAGLAAGGLRRNDTVAIMLPTGADFFYAFFGVVLAGGIPVPIYPPTRPDKIEEYVRCQIKILGNAEVRFLITFDGVKAVSQLIRLNLPGMVDVTTVEGLRKAGTGMPSRKVSPSDTALIQYTSGSTGEPKGVVLSHANILANVRGIGNAVRVRPTDVVVSWLPLYHDMGLIGSWLFSVYYATPITVFSPMAFLRKPERWLWAMHQARATLCPAPNFAYEMCVRKIQDRAIEGLDLSPWRVAINAGEAVLPDTLARFTERFRRYGFRAESFLPCYGLAESSVALAFPPIDRLPLIDTVRRDPFETEGRAEPAAGEEASVLRFVSAGSPIPGHEVRIVDEQGRDAGERRQGRLLFRGLSRTAGYFRNPEATAAVTDAEGWMDSGDLAYWARGELFLTGRRKDCIIKSGRNIAPQEVEQAASQAPGVRQGCVAAFGVADAATGTERLVVVAESRATAPEELRRIKTGIIRSVSSRVGLPPDNVQLVGPHCVPKTSSGKIRRSEARSLYLSGKLEAGERPPWLQIARLGLENAGAWMSLTLRRAAERLRALYVSALLFSTCAVVGLLGRLLPSGPAAGRVFHHAARWFLRLAGYKTQVRADGEIRGPAILVANHPDRLDPLVLGATLPAPFLFAEPGALSSLPRWAAFLLRPLAVGEIQGEVAPRGGFLRQRIRQALEKGNSVLVLPEGPAGQPAHLSRFRLDAFHAAVETASPVHPISLVGTPHPQGRPALGKTARIIAGQAIRPQSLEHREMVRLRSRVREEIIGNCE